MTSTTCDSMKKVIGTKLCLLLMVSAILTYSLRQQWNSVNSNTDTRRVETRDVESRDDNDGHESRTKLEDDEFGEVEAEEATNDIDNDNDDINEKNDNGENKVMDFNEENNYFGDNTFPNNKFEGTPGSNDNGYDLMNPNRGIVSLDDRTIKDGDGFMINSEVDINNEDNKEDLKYSDGNGDTNIGVGTALNDEFKEILVEGNGGDNIDDTFGKILNEGVDTSMIMASDTTAGDEGERGGIPTRETDISVVDVTVGTEEDEEEEWRSGLENTMMTNNDIERSMAKAADALAGVDGSFGDDGGKDVVSIPNNLEGDGEYGGALYQNKLLNGSVDTQLDINQPSRDVGKDFANDGITNTDITATENVRLNTGIINANDEATNTDISSAMENVRLDKGMLNLPEDDSVSTFDPGFDTRNEQISIHIDNNELGSSVNLQNVTLWRANDTKPSLNMEMTALDNGQHDAMSEEPSGLQTSLLVSNKLLNSQIESNTQPVKDDEFGESNKQDERNFNTVANTHLEHTGGDNFQAGSLYPQHNELTTDEKVDDNNDDRADTSYAQQLVKENNHVPVYEGQILEPPNHDAGDDAGGFFVRNVNDVNNNEPGLWGIGSEDNNDNYFNWTQQLLELQELRSSLSNAISNSDEIKQIEVENGNDQTAPQKVNDLSHFSDEANHVLFTEQKQYNLPPPQETTGNIKEEHPLQTLENKLREENMDSIQQPLVFKKESILSMTFNENGLVNPPKAGSSGDQPMLKTSGFLSRTLSSIISDHSDGKDGNRGEGEGNNDIYPYRSIMGKNGDENDNDDENTEDEESIRDTHVQYTEDENYESPEYTAENNLKNKINDDIDPSNFIIRNDNANNNYARENNDNNDDGNNNDNNNIVFDTDRPQTTTPNNNGGSYANPRPLTQDEYNALNTKPYHPHSNTDAPIPTSPKSPDRNDENTVANYNDGIAQNEDSDINQPTQEDVSISQQLPKQNVNNLVEGHESSIVSNDEPFSDLRYEPNPFLTNMEDAGLLKQIVFPNQNYQGREDDRILYNSDKTFADLKYESRISDDEQLDLSNEDQRDVKVTLASLSHCPIKVELSTVAHPVTALVAFPGALVDWMRNAIEQLTGEPSESLYHVMARLKTGDPSSLFQMPRQSVIHTHSTQSTEFDRAIVVIANPVAVERKHLRFLPFAFEWRRYFLWDRTFISWLSSDIPLLVMTADDLIADPEEHLREIASFLDMDEGRVDTSLTCALMERPPTLIDDVSKISGIYSNDRERLSRSIDDVIETASKTVPHILRRLFQYKTVLYI